jgi:hypothetical protein
MPDLNQNQFDGNSPLKYESNDWFYMQPGCIGDTDPKSDCGKNKSEVLNLQNTTNKLSATVTQYNDAKMLYNRELLFMVNIVVGLAMLCYYIYLNQSAIPSLPAVSIDSIGNINNSMRNAFGVPNTPAAQAK